MRVGETQACGRADCGEAEDREWRTAAEECKGERSGSDGAEGASAKGSGPADGRKGAGVNGAPVIPARCPHRLPHSSRVEQVLSPPHSNRGGEQQVQPTAPALPPASSPPKNTHTHTALPGPPSQPNTPSGRARRHQGFGDSISGRKINTQDNYLSKKKDKRQSRLQVKAI